MVGEPSRERRRTGGGCGLVVERNGGARHAFVRGKRIDLESGQLHRRNPVFLDGQRDFQAAVFQRGGFGGFRVKRPFARQGGGIVKRRNRLAVAGAQQAGFVQAHQAGSGTALHFQANRIALAIRELQRVLYIHVGERGNIPGFFFVSGQHENILFQAACFHAFSGFVNNGDLLGLQRNGVSGWFGEYYIFHNDFFKPPGFFVVGIQCQFDVAFAFGQRCLGKRDEQFHARAAQALRFVLRHQHGFVGKVDGHVVIVLFVVGKIVGLVHGFASGIIDGGIKRHPHLALRVFHAVVFGIRNLVLATEHHRNAANAFLAGTGIDINLINAEFLVGRIDYLGFNLKTENTKDKKRNDKGTHGGNSMVEKRETPRLRIGNPKAPGSGLQIPDNLTPGPSPAERRAKAPFFFTPLSRRGAGGEVK